MGPTHMFEGVIIHVPNIVPLKCNQYDAPQHQKYIDLKFSGQYRYGQPFSKPNREGKVQKVQWQI